MDHLEQLIALAIAEDSGLGDVTTQSILQAPFKGKGIIIAKEPMVIAGLDVVKKVFAIMDPDCTIESTYNNGDNAETGDIILKVEGDLTALLKAERIALNFIQRLSGIATLTREYVNELSNDKVRLTDTRKTTPGMRLLEKEAVRAGGAHNHRMSLYDGILIKDNHIAVAGGVKSAVESVKARVSHIMKIEVEVSNMEEVRQAVSAGADVIMLDNMSVGRMAKAVEYINGRAIVEASGNVSLKTLKDIASTGVDVISCGALTHQARALDLSMRITPN